MPLKIELESSADDSFFKDFPMPLEFSLGQNEDLFFRGGRLHYKDQIVLDFDSILRKYQAQKIRKDDLLAKSLGVKSFSQMVDLTMGLGGDLLYGLMFMDECVGIERNPVVFALLWDAARRLKDPRLKIYWKEARDHEFLESAVVYIDPMYPETKKKKSLAKKEMEALKDLCGSDDDQEDLFDLALSGVSKRIVIKRPLKAEIYKKNLMTHQFIGKNIRYDIYCK